MKHTKGPWVVTPDTHRVISMHETIVCSPHESLVGGPTREVKLANANLIAAAPDMLEALERLIRVNGKAVDLMALEPKDRAQRILDAERAITKAKGES